jgi:hypothetical protein
MPTQKSRATGRQNYQNDINQTINEQIEFFHLPQKTVVNFGPVKQNSLKINTGANPLTLGTSFATDLAATQTMIAPDERRALPRFLRKIFIIGHIDLS